MSTDTAIRSQAVLWFVVSVVLIAAPRVLLSFLGLEPTSGSLVVARIFGAELISLALVSWITRNPASPRTLRALCLSYVLCNSLGFAVSLQATLAGVMNAFGWVLVALYGLYATGFALLARAREDSARTAPQL
ncbi:MAG: hypothetical protein ABUT39_10060 [Acidobacteriota bacterium]